MEEVVEDILRVQRKRAGKREETDRDEWLRYVIEMPADLGVPALREAIASRYAFQFELERLFPPEKKESAAAELNHLYLLTITDVPEAELGESPFDLAYDLRQKLEARVVEPDVMFDLFVAQPLRRSAPDERGCWAEYLSDDPNWQLDIMRVPGAWAYSRSVGRRDQGEGVLIAQIDTGHADHAELRNALDLTHQHDFIDDDGDATDPLRKVFLLDTPGHGTSTASVAVSRGSGQVTGSAPKAKLVPIRAIRTVVRFREANVGRGVNHARIKGLPVVTMSLGGFATLPLWRAIDRAEQAGMVLVAAAGNCIPGVWFPANHEKCLALGGIGPTGAKAQCSSFGREVDVSGPAEAVWRAFRFPEPDYPQQGVDGGGEGTSYATALTAGVAALWLAHGTPQRLAAHAASRNESMQGLFTRLIRATARPVGNWDFANFGRGIVDAEALLRATDAELAAHPPAPPAVARGPAIATALPDNYQTVLRQNLDNAARLSGADAEGLGLRGEVADEFALELTVLLQRARAASVANYDLRKRAEMSRTARPMVSRRLSSNLPEVPSKRLETMLKGVALTPDSR
jgi:hypothetical protein